MRKIIINLLVQLSIFLVIGLLGNSRCYAQLNGLYTIPGSFPTIAAAATNLNLVGVSGNVTFNIAAGYTENAPVGGIVLQYGGGVAVANQSNAAQTVVFQKSGAGANPIISAYIGTQTSPYTSLDGIVKIVGSDYITFDGIDVSEIAGNITSTTMMEFGYGLLRESNTNGTQNCVIKNSTITLNNSHITNWGAIVASGSIGIFSGPINNSSITALAPAGATIVGANSNNKFYSNTISNVTSGIFVLGIADVTSPYSFYDQTNIIGNAALGGNTIQNFSAYGVYAFYQNNAIISNNTIDNDAASGAAAVANIYGIYHNTSTNSSPTITNNTILMNAGVFNGTCSAIFEAVTGTGTVNINNNTLTVTGGSTAAAINYRCIERGASLALLNTLNVNSNNFRNINVAFNNNGTTGSVYLFFNPNIVTTLSFQNNLTSGTATPYVDIASGAAINNDVSCFHNFCIYNTAGTFVISNNTFTEIRLTGTFSNFRVIYEYAGRSITSGGNTITKTIENNIIQNISCTGTVSSLVAIREASGVFSTIINNNLIETISGANVIHGMNIESETNVNCHHNTISNITPKNGYFGIYTASSTIGLVHDNVVNNFSRVVPDAAGVCAGIRIENVPVASTVEVYNNLVYDLSGGSSADGIVTLDGMSFTGTSTSTISIYNNLVAQLTYGNSAAGNGPVTGLRMGRGIYKVYFNTIALGLGAAMTSSATNFGVAGVSYAGNTNTLDLRNNIIYVNATKNGTGIISALQRVAGVGGTAPTNFAATSNYNIYYAPIAADSYLYSEGTTTATVVNAYNLTNDPSFNFNCSTYKTFMSTANEDSTATEIPPFIGAGIPNVKYSLTAASLSYAESGGQNLAAVPTDFNAVSRPNNLVTNRPDIGFTEFVGSKNSFSICIVLPIELLSFSGELIDNYSKITWVTASEINNDYFILQKSDDGIVWREITRIDGAGNSTELLNYSFNDFEMSSEIMYYKLIQVDYDGSNTMSDIVSVQVKNDELVIYPNPSSAIFTIHSNDIIRNINVLDNFGRLVMQNNSSSIDLSDFEKGVYQLSITTDSKTIIKKIIKI